MRIGFKSSHWRDANGNPSGGCTTGVGFTISWQNGPLGRHGPQCLPGNPCGDGCTRIAPNGAFVEDVLDAVADRIKCYQESRFACDSNAVALGHIQLALVALDSRTKQREMRAVEGTHAV